MCFPSACHSVFLPIKLDLEIIAVLLWVRDLKIHQPLATVLTIQSQLAAFSWMPFPKSSDHHPRQCLTVPGAMILWHCMMLFLLVASWSGLVTALPLLCYTCRKKKQERKGKTVLNRGLVKIGESKLLVVRPGTIWTLYGLKDTGMPCCHLPWKGNVMVHGWYGENCHSLQQNSSTSLVFKL